jgi:hypothetical protein
MRHHLDNDKSTLETCLEVEKAHLHYCINRTTQFLETGQDQPPYEYQGV